MVPISRAQVSSARKAAWRSVENDRGENDEVRRRSLRSEPVSTSPVARPRLNRGRLQCHPSSPIRNRPATTSVGRIDMRNAPFEVHPIAGALGAELRGVEPGRGPARCHDRGDPPGAARSPGDLLPRPGPAARALPVAAPAASARRSSIRSSRASTASRRSSTSPSSSTRRSTSAASGTPTRPICRSRRWPRCWSRARCRRAGGDTLFANQYLALRDAVGRHARTARRR